MATGEASKSGGSTSAVKSALRTLDIIELAVANPGGIVAQDISRSLAIPVSSLSYLLATLVERGYLEKDGRRYVPGPGLERLGGGSAGMSLADRARPHIRAIRSRYDETTSLFVLEGWSLRAAITETSEQMLRYSVEVGRTTPLHCVAAGKAILARLDAERLNAFFREAELAPFTPATLIREQDVRAQLEQVRRDGYAVAREEFTPGLSAVACAILEDGKPVASLSVAVPTARFDDAKFEAIVALLREAAEALNEVSIPPPQ